MGFLFLALPPSVLAQGLDPAADQGGPGADEVLTYVAVLEPVADPDLAAALTASSRLVAPAGDEDEVALRRFTPFALIRRVRADLERMEAGLRSEGFYGGRARAKVAGLDVDDPALPERLARIPSGAAAVAILLSVEAGARYVIRRIEVRIPENAPPLPLPEGIRTLLPLSEGAPARAQPIIDAEAAMIEALRGRGHAFAVSLDRDALVDHDAQAMELTWTVDAGPVAELGPVTFTGQARTRESFLTALVPWQPGRRFHPDRLAKLRRSLLGLGVFASVIVEPAEVLNADGRLHVTARLEERPARFVGASADYATAEGFGLRGFWGHRNLFGGAEQVEVEAYAERLVSNPFSEIEYGLDLDLTKPAFLDPDQTLALHAGFAADRTDAFDREAVELAGSIARPLTDHLRLEAGGEVEIARLTDDDGSGRPVEREVGLLALPASLIWDDADSLLAPTRGTRARLTLIAYPVMLGDGTVWAQARASASHYLGLDAAGRFILAGRIGVGGSLAPSTRAIPAARRFYAGGGGSVRGYEFQKAGPLQPDGDPQGGRSLLEAGIELRARLTKTIGMVPFIDAGTVYDRTFPDFSEPLRLGAGLGVRYYSPIGPIRADFAMPLNRRDEDSLFQFYISIGEAF